MLPTITVAFSTGVLILIGDEIFLSTIASQISGTRVRSATLDGFLALVVKGLSFAGVGCQHVVPDDPDMLEDIESLKILRHKLERALERG